MCECDYDGFACVWLDVCACMHMCKCVCVALALFTYASMCSKVSVLICTVRVDLFCLNVWINGCVRFMWHMRVLVCTRVYVFVCWLYVFLCRCKCVYLCVSVCTCSYVCVRVRMCVRLLVHACLFLNLFVCVSRYWALLHLLACV